MRCRNEVAHRLLGDFCMNVHKYSGKVAATSLRPCCDLTATSLRPRYCDVAAISQMRRHCDLATATSLRSRHCDVAATSPLRLRCDLATATSLRHRHCDVAATSPLRRRCDLAATQAKSPRMLACHTEDMYKPHLRPILTVVQWSNAYSISSEMRARRLLVCLV